MNLAVLFAVMCSSLLRLASANDLPMTEENPVMDCFPTSCGGLKNISFPFWVDKQQPAHCGYPSFRLNCSDHIPTIQLSPGEFHVKEIFYENQSVWLSSTATMNLCEDHHWNLSFSLTPFTISSDNKELTLLHGCSDPQPNNYKLPCAASHSVSVNGTLAYLVNQYSGSLGSCQAVKFPVLGDPSAVSVSNYLTLLTNGFLVNWIAADCTVCRQSGRQCGYSNMSDTFMCICPDRAHTRFCIGDANSESGGHKRIIIGTVGGLASFLLLFVTSAIYFARYRRSSNSVIFCGKNSSSNQNIETFLEEYGPLSLKRYSYSDVKKITKSFQEKLGQGGCGTVYRGTLRNGHMVAVKILNNSQGNGDDFINEVASIGRTYHVNIVSLLGFCSEGSKRALIYDYMCNGSLEKFLNLNRSKTAADWEKLYQIAVGIARGLEYLHSGCKTGIVHFDIKPHNILLDEDFCPKISDFGLAKLCLNKESIISIAGMRGTVGYIAPEVFSRIFGVVSSKSDVYSYGMMVLEMTEGRKNPNVGAENSSEMYFPHWIYEYLEQNRDLLTSGVSAESEETVRKMMLVGLWCIQAIPANRPSMSRVIEMLEGSVGDLQVPPKPYLSSASFGSLVAATSIQDVCCPDTSFSSFSLHVFE